MNEKGPLKGEYKPVLRGFFMSSFANEGVKNDCDNVKDWTHLPKNSYYFSKKTESCNNMSEFFI